MQRCSFVGFLALVTWLVGTPPGRAQERPVVAVFDVEVRGVKLSKLARSNLAAYLSARLGASGAFELVPRDQIKHRLVDQKKVSFKECYDRNCQIEIGRELAAQKTLSTQILKIGRKCVVTSTLFDLRKATAEESATEKGGCSEEGIMASIDAVVQKLSGGEDAKTAACIPGDRPGCERLCRRKGGGACFELGEIIRKGPDGYKHLGQLAGLYAKSCKGGHEDGCAALGWAIMDGDGVAKDYPKAFTLCQKACAQGSARGCACQGWLHLEQSAYLDYPKARAQFQKAIDGGDPTGLHGLAWATYQGRGGEVDRQAGLGLAQKGCDQGDASSCAGVGWMANELEEPERAMAAFKKAFAGGRLDGLLGQAWLYKDGRGVKADPARAKKLFEQVTTNGKPFGKTGLAFMYRTGQALPKDQKKAAALLDEACRDDDRWACVHLGWMLYSGDGVGKDDARALRLFRQACELGFPYACTPWGRMIREGRGTAADAQRAVALFEKACQGGDGYGCSELGWRQRNGEGAPRSPQAAVKRFERACARGDKWGCESLGWAYKDLPQVQDFDKARKAFEQAGADNQGAQVGIALLHRYGQGTPRDLKKAITILEKACDTRTDGCLHLAWIYRDEAEVRDEKKAAAHFKTACDRGDMGGCEQLGWATKDLAEVRDYDRARALFEKAAAGGNLGALVGLGTLYRLGQGVERDLKKAIAHLERACTEGLPLGYQDGCFHLGLLLKDVPEVQDLPRALRLFERAAAQGFLEAYNQVGYLYRMGMGVARDPQQAVKRYEKGCELGAASACEGLGWLRKDDPQARDYAKAIHAFQRAAALGSSGATVGLGHMYKDGQGTQADANKAREFFQRGVDLGNPYATEGIGWLYRQGKGVARDLARAMQLFQQACDGNDVWACNHLAWMLEDGQDGVAKDPARAFGLFEKSCAGGLAWGCGGLGVMYERGHGTKQNHARAAELSRQACTGGDGGACHNLAVAHTHGKGVPKDPGLAKTLFARGCSLGYQPACAGR